MNITTEEAELQAVLFSGLGFGTCAITIRSLAAERDDLEKTAMQAAQCHEREMLRADALQAQNARLRDALKKLLSYAERNECHHESTHRGGIVWTICDDCGSKWADDEGGFKPYCEPVEITAARQALGDNQ